MLWELCMVLGIARQHEALADVLARTTMAGSDGAAFVQCQAEASSKIKASHMQSPKHNIVGLIRLFEALPSPLQKEYPGLHHYDIGTITGRITEIVQQHRATGVLTGFVRHRRRC